MASRIIDLRQLYGKLSLTLPEELLDADLERQLNDHSSSFETIYKEDRNALQEIINAKNEQRYLSLEKIDNGNYLLVNGLQLDSKKLKNSVREQAKYLLSHWFMSVYGLKMITKAIIDELRITKDYYLKYLSPTDEGHDKRSAFLTFTRGYQAVTGYAISANELIEEYEQFYSHACHRVDQSYPISRTTLHSAIQPRQLLTAAITLLLRANSGRETCPPLLRSAVEVVLSRTVLDTEGTKHSGKIAVPTRSLTIDGLAEAVKQVGIILPYNKDAISALYDWGSQSIHLGYRMRTCEMWTAWIVANNLSGLENEKILPEKREQIIDKFVEQGKAILVD